MKLYLTTFFVLLVFTTTLLARGTYQEPKDFLHDTFPEQTPEPHVIWIKGDLKTQIDTILGHAYHSLRIRYWKDQKTSAWILEEVGKDKLITTGIVVDDGKISRLKVLVFRESRGGEVRYPFFTDQFKDAKLKNSHKLDRHIDNISGATLSVRALVKLARLALVLDRHINHTHATP